MMHAIWCQMSQLLIDLFRGAALSLLAGLEVTLLATELCLIKPGECHTRKEEGGMRECSEPHPGLPAHECVHLEVCSSSSS